MLNAAPMQPAITLLLAVFRGPRPVYTDCMPAMQGGPLAAPCMSVRPQRRLWVSASACNLPGDRYHGNRYHGDRYPGNRSKVGSPSGMLWKACLSQQKMAI